MTSVKEHFHSICDKIVKSATGALYILVGTTCTQQAYLREQLLTTQITPSTTAYNYAFTCMKCNDF